MDYWKIVNDIQTAQSPKEIRMRCNEAEKLIRADDSIDNGKFDELMRTIAYLYRESYDMEK